MTITITKEEIINYYNWEYFYESLKNEIDFKLDVFTLSLEQTSKSGIIKNQNLNFQTIYKNKIVTDCYNNIDDALEDIKDYSVKNNLDKNCISIEVLIERDYIRKNGGLDTRASLEYLSKEFVNEENIKNINKIDNIKNIVNQLNNILK